MFSQNVIDAREFMIEPGESVWDSQQNSQAWGFSQNSNSQIVPGSSSQNSFKYSSEFSRRQNSSSVNSDYWSQSQSISQPLPEKDSYGYHLKYISKPPLISVKNDDKASNDRSHAKSLSQCLELQKSRTFDLNSSNKLDVILAAFRELSQEVHSNMSAVKSEIAIEINGVSEKLLSEVKDTAQRLDKFSAEVKESSKLLTENIQKALQMPSECFQKTNSSLEKLELQMEKVKAQILISEELGQQNIEKADKNLIQIESSLSVMMSHLKKSKSEQCTQTDLARLNKIDYRTAQMQHEEGTTEGFAPGMQFSKDSIHGKPDFGIGIQRQAIQSNTPLSHVSPACKSITSAGISQMMASPSVKHSDMIKEEEQSDDDYSSNVIRRASTRSRHLESNASTPSVIFFDLCSDMDDSESSPTLSKTHTKQKDRSPLLKVSSNLSGQYETPCKNTHDKQFCSLKASKATNPSIQKSITSYGKIKKDNSNELAKIDGISKLSKRMKVSKISPNLRNFSPKPNAKETVRVSSRGSVAMKRKAYAESIFRFDDYVDIKKFQFQMHKPKNKLFT